MKISRECYLCIYTQTLNLTKRLKLDENKASEILTKICNTLPQLKKIKIKLPVNKETQSLISWIYEKASVTYISYDRLVTLSVECNPSIKNKIIFKCEKLEGEIIK